MPAAALQRRPALITRIRIPALKSSLRDGHVLDPKTNELIPKRIYRLKYGHGCYIRP